MQMRERDEAVNYISKCRKMTQEKFKRKNNWVGKVVCMELCKILKFDHADKWNRHKPEYVPEDETNANPWTFRDMLMTQSRPGDKTKYQLTKKKLLSRGYCCSSGLQREMKTWNLNESKTWRKMEIVVGAVETNLKEPKKKIRGIMKTIHITALLRSPGML